MSDSNPHRILIVDDDAHLLHNVKRTLERQGYVVSTHEGGPGCSHEIHRFAPDLLLLDLRMPFLSGEALLDLIATSRNLSLPTIVLYSALDEQTLIRKTRDCGADGYISKGDSALEFARKVAAFLRLGRAHRDRVDS